MANRITTIAQTLKITPEEVYQMLNDDETIDKGGRCEWEPTLEQEKQMRIDSQINIHHTHRGEKNNKTNKPSEDRQVILKALTDGISTNNNIKNVIISNNTLKFQYNDANYSVKLIRHYDNLGEQ